MHLRDYRDRATAGGACCSRLLLLIIQCVFEDKIEMPATSAGAMQDRTKSMLVLARSFYNFAYELKLKDEDVARISLPFVLTRGSDVRPP